MPNFAQDLSTHAYLWEGAAFANSTGVITDAAGVSVDIGKTVGCMISAALIIGGRSGTGTPTLTTTMQESTDGTTWTTATTFAAQTVSNTVVVTSYLATKRYQRATHTILGTNPVFPAHVMIVGPRRIAPLGDGGFDNTAAGQ